MAQTAQTRDEIRAIYLATSKLKRVKVEYSGGIVEVQELTIRGHNNLVNACTIEQRNGKEKRDDVALLIKTAIETTYVPGTDIKVFDLADYDQLEKDSLSGGLKRLEKAIVSFMKTSLEDINSKKKL